ncbi:MAG TPA: hypothetical protein PKD84_10685 [Propionicimonas sp.]|nr:hypothetical protein [Propionicimonas sp.]
MTPTTPRAEDHTRRRKVAALLSSGLVVGIGTAASLAGWNTEEYASAQFSPGTTSTAIPSTSGTDPARSPQAGLPTSLPVPIPTATTSAPAPTTAPPIPVPTEITSPPSPPPLPPPAGTFVLVGSTDGVSYRNHATASSAAMLAFSERASRLSPGEGVAAPFALRLSQVGEDVGTVTMVTTVTGSGSHLSYGLFTTASFGCRMNTATTSTLIPAGTPLAGTATSTTVTMPLPDQGSTEGAPIYLCIKVRADHSLVPGSKHQAGWVFRADAD